MFKVTYIGVHDFLRHIHSRGTISTTVEEGEQTVTWSAVLQSMRDGWCAFLRTPTHDRELNKKLLKQIETELNNLYPLSSLQKLIDTERPILYP